MRRRDSNGVDEERVLAILEDNQSSCRAIAFQQPHLALCDPRGVVLRHRHWLATDDRNIMLVGTPGELRHAREVTGDRLADCHDRASTVISVFTELAMKQSSCA